MKTENVTLKLRDGEMGAHIAYPQRRPAGAICLAPDLFWRQELCYLMCCRMDIDCAVAYYGTYIEHSIREANKLHRPFMLHMAMKDRWVQAEVNELLDLGLADPSANDDGVAVF